MKSEVFAKWTYERDKKVGCVDGSWEQHQQYYMAEAEFYMNKPQADWPCGILAREGTHKELHPDCTDQSWEQ